MVTGPNCAGWRVTPSANPPYMDARVILRPTEPYAAACLPHNALLAIRAPSTRDFNFAHMIVGWTRRANGLCAKPQSVPPTTFLAADDLRQPDNALGNEFRVLDDVGGMA